MTTAYLDTNILIALVKSNDNDHSASLDLIKKFPGEFVTGTITLVELSSVLSREFENLHLEDIFNAINDDLNHQEIILVIIGYLLQLSKLKILSDPPIEPLTFLRSTPDVNPIAKLAIKLSYEVQMRTLDLFHFGTSYYYHLLENPKITYFVTADAELLKKGKNYTADSGIIFIEPQALLDLIF
jgi:predicted nucleic acid-binding protein